MPHVKPILLALVLCDSVIREAGTGKHSLIGTFNGIFSTSFPCIHPFCSVYIAITEGRGRVPCALRMTSLSSNKLVFDCPGMIEFGGPASVGELVFQLQNVKFDEPGVYSVEFWADKELLGSRKVTAQRVEER